MKKPIPPNVVPESPVPDPMVGLSIVIPQRLAYAIFEAATARNITPSELITLKFRNPSAYQVATSPSFN